MAAIIGNLEALTVPGEIGACQASARKNNQNHPFEPTRVGFYVIQRGFFRYADRQLAEILGYEDPNALIGHSFWQWVHPEDRGCVCLVKGEKAPFRCMKNDGTVLWVQMSGLNMPFDAKPANVGFLRHHEMPVDSSLFEKQMSLCNARLQAVFNSVQDAIITVDNDLKVIKANAAAETICGLAAETLQGQVFPQCHTCGGIFCGTILRQTLDKKATIQAKRVQCPARHPRQRVDISSTPILGAGGQLAGAALIIRDVSLLFDTERLFQERHPFHAIIGQSDSILEIDRLVENLSDLETTVLVSGESGTGKEHIARALHFRGRRAGKPFIRVNCSALSETLLESELFGHARGAFTGAVQDKAGRFREADGGTILLDDIGDISPLLQRKLLRVLQEKSFERIGESVSRKVDVRVIACTAKDLKRKVRIGDFREDLYRRLKLAEIALPPLRERLEDVPLLADHFRRIFSSHNNRTIGPLSREVVERFITYQWPGNVQELKHVTERALLLCDGCDVTGAQLPLKLRNLERLAGVPGIIPIHASEDARDLLDALSRVYWNRSKAADLLGVSRQTLYRKLRTYKIFEMM